MSNLDEVRINILGKFKQALDLDGQQTVLPFVRLALLDQQAAFDAILLQRQAAQGDQSTYDSIYESMQNQIARLNYWLAENAVDLYHEPYTDTGEAMVKAANRLAAQLAQVRTELAAAIDERNFADKRCAELEQQLEQQLAQLDADNAALIRGNGKSQPAAVLVQTLDDVTPPPAGTPADGRQAREYDPL